MLNGLKTVLKNDYLGFESIEHWIILNPNLSRDFPWWFSEMDTLKMHIDASDI
jgi:hypothetical protein